MAFCSKFVFTVILVILRQSSCNGDVLSHGCTSGFMSVDRMERVLGLYGPQDVVQSFNTTSIQAVFPGMNFTCNGSIQSWIFGAEWFRNSPAYTELQIWRKSNEYSYTKVGRTEIRIEREESTRYYEYTLSSPLHYQAGDIVGYFQASSSTSQLGLLYENMGSGHLLYYSVRSIPANTFNILTTVSRGDVRPIITLTPDFSGCACGFVSVERTHLLLGVEDTPIKKYTKYTSRQQITPAIQFTCDSMITKWIVGGVLAKSHSLADSTRVLFPELQVWRNTTDNTYTMIHGTPLKASNETTAGRTIIKYDNFQPFPVEAGDVLGIFLPSSRSGDVQFEIYSEYDGPVNYVVDIDSTATLTPFNAIHLSNNTLVSHARYHPMVSVEIISNKSSTTASAPATKEKSTTIFHHPPLEITAASVGKKMSTTHSNKRAPVTTAAFTGTFLRVGDNLETNPTRIIASLSDKAPKPTYALPKRTPIPSFFQVTTSSTLPPSLPIEDNTTSNNILLYIAAGVIGVLLAIIVTFIIIIAILCQRLKQNDKSLVMHTSHSRNSDTLTDNAAYTGRAPRDHIHPTGPNHIYDYPTLSTERRNTIITAKFNRAYNVSSPSQAAWHIPSSINPAYKATSPTDV